MSSFFFHADDGIRDLVRSRGLGDGYKGQAFAGGAGPAFAGGAGAAFATGAGAALAAVPYTHLTLSTILRV